MQLWQLQITVPVSSLTSESDISQGWPSAASLNQRQASPPTAAPATLLKADLPWNSGLQAHLAGNSIPEHPQMRKIRMIYDVILSFLRTVYGFHLT